MANDEHVRLLREGGWEAWRSEFPNITPDLKALAEGHELTTIEGLEGPNGELHPIQEAYVAHTGFQCSYCTPGFILTTKALLEEQPDVTRDEAKAYLAGNLCRCGSYVKILDSVMDARERVRGG